MTYIHSKLRPHQEETYLKIKNSEHSNIILQAPTGSGKSFHPAQLAADGYRVLVLVKTKSLQAQYANSYGFTLLYGKNNYECMLQSKIDQELFTNQQPGYEIPTADVCPKEEKHKSFCYHNCPYPRAREEFLGSNAGVLNYSKFLLDKRLIEEFHPDYLFLDECHELSDTVVDFSGLEINWSKWIREYVSPIEINSPQLIAFYEGKEFLEEFKWSLNRNKPLEPKHGGNVRKYKFWENRLREVTTTLSLMSNEKVWFVTSDKDRFLCRPLTARFDYSHLFSLAPKVVQMSATVGNPQYFVRELGIEEYEFINVPNVWHSVLRPIYSYNGVKITGQSTRQDRIEHAKVIASCINKCPKDWNGLVHVTSKDMARELGGFVQDMTGRPVWTSTNGLGTEEALREWNDFDCQNEGAIAVTWQFYSGADFGNLAINISARTPYPDFNDLFGAARFNFDKTAARGRVANSLEQQQGRNRRGYLEHYGPTARKFNAIVDSKWSRLKSALNKSFIDSIVYK